MRAMLQQGSELLKKVSLDVAPGSKFSIPQCPNVLDANLCSQAIWRENELRRPCKPGVTWAFDISAIWGVFPVSGIVSRKRMRNNKCLYPLLNNYNIHAF